MNGTFDTLINAFRMPELKKKISYTIFILGIYAVGLLIPVAALNRQEFTQCVMRMGSIGSLMNMVSGGGLYSATIFAMGISPYINSSIIIQLLTVIIPRLETLAKEGQAGRKKMQRITRYVTIALALVQSSMFCWSTRSAMLGTIPTWLNAILVIVSFTAGTCFVVWLGERINEKGIGNGVSLIIFAGIVTRLPNMISELYGYSEDASAKVDNAVLGGVLGIVVFLVVFLVAVGIIVGVVYVQNAERRIPVQYSRKTVGRKVYGAQSSYIPIKVNQSGVMPVIFAMSILSMPQLIIGVFFQNSTSNVVNWFKDFQNTPFYYIAYFLLIVFFTFFYSSIQFNPIEIGNSIQKNGGFITGIRPGKQTTDYIRTTAWNLNWADALFLSLVCIVPTIVGAATGLANVWFAGTSVLILTGVANDLIVQLESQFVTRSYKGFLD